MIFNKWWEKSCPTLKLKTLWEKLLGALACEPEHEFLSLGILLKKILAKKNSVYRTSEISKYAEILVAGNLYASLFSSR